MATFFTSHHFTAFTFLILFLKIQSFDPVSSFNFTDFGKDPNFKSIVGLYHNAKVASGGSEALLYGSEDSAKWIVRYKKPIRVVDVDGKPKMSVSFSTYFEFSLSLGDGNGLAFVMAPKDADEDDDSSSRLPFDLKVIETKDIAVEFIASNKSSASFSINIKVGTTPVKKINVSSFNMVIRNGGKLYAWIDYQASSRHLEVRLSRYGHSKPVDPLLSEYVDLSNNWKTGEMFVGFDSMKGRPSQPCFLYSWSFNLRHYPQRVHSEPLDPKAFSAKNIHNPSAGKPRSDCVLKILAAMIFGAGCGALAAFTVLYLWTMFGNRRPVAVVPEECVMQPVDFEYKKVNIVVDKPLKDAKE
ncbi:unnamed protein product [Trifolium pratense]|uniref:Uncharacterized protein n=1 Tax=Trifolium pratense TaxID=57577 RepID=A0ACB0LMF6_TRIPR|nr:unnamed protein product [Trifolium pratense]